MKKQFLIILIMIFAGNLAFSQTKKEAVEISLKFLSNLEQQDFNGNNMYMADARSTVELSTKMKDAWNFQCDRLGNYVALKSVKFDKFSDYEIVYLICEFQKSDFTLKFVFNKNLKITDVYFIPYPPLIPAGKLNMLWIIAFLILWELAWKALGLWKAAQNHQLVWFIILFILPTVGLLPLVYVLFLKNRVKPV